MWTALTVGWGLLAYLVVYCPEAHLLVIWALTGRLVVWKHRRELGTPLRFRLSTGSEDGS